MSMRMWNYLMVREGEHFLIPREVELVAQNIVLFQAEHTICFVSTFSASVAILLIIGCHTWFHHPGRGTTRTRRVDV